MRSPRRSSGKAYCGWEFADLRTGPAVRLISQNVDSSGSAETWQSRRQESLGWRSPHNGLHLRLSPRERDEAEAEGEGSKTALYLVGDYEAAASIPIGATLPHLEQEHELLPAAFYEVFTTNLGSGCACTTMRR